MSSSTTSTKGNPRHIRCVVRRRQDDPVNSRCGADLQESCSQSQSERRTPPNSEPGRCMLFPRYYRHLQRPCWNRMKKLCQVLNTRVARVSSTALIVPWRTVSATPVVMIGQTWDKAPPKSDPSLMHTLVLIPFPCLWTLWSMHRRPVSRVHDLHSAVGERQSLTSLFSPERGSCQPVQPHLSSRKGKPIYV